MKRTSTFLCGILMLLSLTNRGGAATSEMLKYGGMEGPYVDGVAAGWGKNCYGINDVTFSEETKDVHGGKAAQRVTCTKFVTGGVQFRLPGIAVEKDKPYTLVVWLKGDCKSPVYVGIRKHDAPYTRYLVRYVHVTNEWRPYLVMGKSTGTDPECGIYIMFASEGTLLVDDVSLAPGINEESIKQLALPPVKGNRVYNSGFETGPEGWTPVGRFALASPGHSGRFCAHVTSMGIESRPFPVRTAQRYAVSAFIKAAKPNTRVNLKLSEWADVGGDRAIARNEVTETVHASTTWQRYDFSGVVLPNLWNDYILRIVPANDIDLDDVQVEEGALTDYAPANPIEVGAETSTRWCVEGDKVDVTAHVAAPAKAFPLNLTYTLEDLWSRPVQTIVHTLPKDAPDHATFETNELGMFRVKVQAGDSPATGEVWYGVFPPRDRKPQPDSPFGIHVADTAPDITNTLLASEAMGARWVRLHDFGDYCHWRVVEPVKGTFVWHDAEINDLVKRGFTILANLGHPPLWAGRQDPKRTDYGTWTNAPPRDMTEWENYIAATVNHYKDHIHYWEIWNEPYGSGFFIGTPEEYAQLLKTAYQTIKRIDPKAVVLGGCFSPSAEDWTKRVFAAGGYQYMDELSYHQYWNPQLTQPLSPGGPSLITQNVEQYIDLMKKQGAVKPIFMSEGGIRCPPFASWLPKQGFESTGVEAAAGLVKGMVEMLSAGVTHICYYYAGGAQGAMPWFSTMANGYYVLTDYDGRPKPTMMAYSALEGMVGAAKAATVVHSPILTAHVFSKGDSAVAVMWSDKPLQLSVPGAEVFDLMGNAMKTPELEAGTPVYVQAPGVGAAALATKLHDLR